MNTRPIVPSHPRGLIGLLVFAFHLSPASASVEIASFSVNERDGTIDATIKVVSTSQATWSLDYETVSGTASDETGDNDYGSVSDKFTFGQGTTVHQVPIDIVQDVKIEGTEYFELAASNLQQQSPLPGNGNEGGVNGDLGSVYVGTITIIDDDTELFVALALNGGDTNENLVTLECDSGDIDGTGQLFNSRIAGDYPGGAARFEVLNYGPPQLVCSAFQTNGSPAGYSDTTAGNCDPGFNAFSDSCFLNSVYNVASFDISKTWVDDSTGPAEVMVECSSGGLDGSGSSLQQYFIGSGAPTTVGIEGFHTASDASGESTTCSVVEVNVPELYAALHTATGDSANSPVNATSGCRYGPLAHDDFNLCAIFNAWQLLFSDGFEAGQQ